VEEGKIYSGLLVISLYSTVVSIKLEENEGVGDRGNSFAVHAPITYKITRSEIRPYSL